MSPARALTTVMVSLCLLLAPQAHAQATAEDKAAADSLFREARDLMAQGKYAAACPKLVASHRLDPAIGTALNLGDCYEKAGQTASAWASFNHAEFMARNARDKPRGDEAARRAKALETQLSKLVIDVVAGSRAPGLEVRRDGTLLDAGLWGSAIPVDPGVHTIGATAPGKQAWTTTVLVETKPGVVTVRVPALIPAPRPQARAGEAPSGSDDDQPSTWSTQRTAGLVVGGVGVVGVVIGAIFGVDAIGKNDDSLASCLPNDPGQCDADGVELREDAYTSARVSTVVAALGGAAFVGGAIVFLTAPSAAPSKSTSTVTVVARPTLGMTGPGLVLQGEW